MRILVLFVRSNGRSPAREFIDSIENKRDKIKLKAWLIKLEEKGHKLVRPYAGTARGKIKYLRVNRGTMCYRLFYFFDRNKIVVTNGYIKKDNKLSEKEIDMAEKLRKEYLSRKK